MEQLNGSNLEAHLVMISALIFSEKLMGGDMIFGIGFKKLEKLTYTVKRNKDLNSVKMKFVYYGFFFGQTSIGFLRWTQ